MELSILSSNVLGDFLLLDRVATPGSGVCLAAREATWVRTTPFQHLQWLLSDEEAR